MAVIENPALAAVMQYAMDRKGWDTNRLSDETRMHYATLRRYVNGAGRQQTFNAIGKVLGLPDGLLTAVREGRAADVKAFTRDDPDLQHVALNEISLHSKRA